MASSSSSSEPNIDDSANSNATLRQPKRRKITHNHQPTNQNSPNLIPWTSQSKQRIYSTNLLRSLRRSPPSPAARQVRDTADRILARAAKGRTRWSRAILVSPRWKKLRRNKVRKVENDSNRLKKMRITGGDRKSKKMLPAMQKKARVLSGLVPGCKKVSFQNLLEETSDYISALEMQVRAMTALAELLAGRMVS